ncbi:MAG: phosphatidate cytidylyltransferase [Pseudomonadota bacterium]
MNKPHIVKTGRNLAGRGELASRVISALVLLAIILAASWAGDWLFLILCVALSAVVFYEWHGLVSRTAFDMPEALLTAGFIALVVSVVTGWFVVVGIAFLVLGLILELTHHGDERSDVRWMGLGALYCVIPVATLPFIREHGGLGLLLLLYFSVWATDVVAYFAGRQFGGPKLMPSVSPKKTWSGALGGVAGAVIIGIVFANLDGQYSLAVSVGMAIMLSVFCQIGDLFESWVKRMVGAKDSSALIPGHGGFLDRVDGLVAAAVPVAVFVAMSI